MNVSIKWTPSISANGVFVTEFDCEVECMVRPIYGCEGQYEINITAINVHNGIGMDRKVTDLMDRDSGLFWLGEKVRERLMTDDDFEASAMEEYHDLKSYNEAAE